MKTEPLLTASEVATFLGVSQGWVRDHITRRQPRLPLIRIGKRRGIIRFRRSEIEAFLAEHSRNTKDSA